MSWSAETPTAPGWYWHRSEPGGIGAPDQLIHEVVYLRAIDGTLYHHETSPSFDRYTSAASMGGEWFGPLEPPE